MIFQGLHYHLRTFGPQYSQVAVCLVCNTAILLIRMLLIEVLRGGLEKETTPWWTAALAELMYSGGGLAIYNSAGVRVGGIGVSGDTSCRDHMVAWELRHNLNLDYVPAGLSNFPRPDNIIFDIDENGDSPSGFGHPNCLDKAGEINTANNLSPTR